MSDPIINPNPAASDTSAIGSSGASQPNPAPVVSVPPQPVAATPLPSAEQAQLANMQQSLDLHSALLPLKADLENGKLKIDQLPTIELLEFRGVVANEAAMLALPNLTFGDVVGRADDSNNLYILVGIDGTIAGNWLATTITVPAVDTSRMFAEAPAGDLRSSNSDITYLRGTDIISAAKINGGTWHYFCEYANSTTSLLDNGYRMGLGNGLYNWKEFQLVYNHAGNQYNVLRHHGAGNFDHRGLIFDQPVTFNSYTKARLDSQGWRTIRSACNSNQKGRFVIEESTDSQAGTSDENMNGFAFGYDGQSSSGNHNKGFLGTIDSGTQHLSIEFARATGAMTFQAAVDFNGQTVTGLNLVPEYKTERWAFTTDSHAYFTNAGGNQRISDLCQEMGNHRPSMVVHGGDWIEKPSTALTEAQIRRLNRYKSFTGCPWYHVAGNHDIALPVSFEQPEWDVDDDGVSDAIDRTNKFYTYSEDEYVLEDYELNTNNAENLGYYRKYHRPTGVHHIVLNSCQQIGSPQLGWIPQAAQMTWLQNELNSLNANGRVVIYSHVPPRGGESYLGWRAAERDQLHTMLTGFSGKILAVLSGHMHDNNRTTVDGIDYIRMVNSEGDTKDDPYNEDNTNRLAYALLEWNEATSTFSIVGYNGQTSYTIDKS